MKRQASIEVNAFQIPTDSTPLPSQQDDLDGEAERPSPRGPGGSDRLRHRTGARFSTMHGDEQRRKRLLKPHMDVSRAFHLQSLHVKQTRESYAR